MEPRKLLIVDDDEDLLRGLSVRLKACGYQVVHAADGIQAISVAMKEAPDLILLDIGLPGGNGYVVMERLKSINATSGVPIIVLSARDPATDRQRALDAGAAAYYQKPVDNALLLWALRQEYA
jgi:DNA-binding response OmpR family regulator